MPNMNGIDLANRLRDQDITTPIILITGYPDENIPAKAAAAGLKHVLLKPHLEESLIAHIRQAMQERPAAG
jgi:FixJ family two-component response regulator